MTNRIRHRLTGTLSESARGLVLECDDGSIWALDLSQNGYEQLGKRVTVEGLQVGLDRLTVDWLGLVTSPIQS